MKTINEKFTDKEFALLQKAKDVTEKNWHDTLLFLAEMQLGLTYGNEWRNKLGFEGVALTGNMKVEQ